LQSNFYGRGGIVFWADLVGAKHIYNSLKKWTQLYGNFYKPSRYLEERATKGIPLVRQKSPSLSIQILWNLVFLISFMH
jgi:hypothetical protein